MEWSWGTLVWFIILVWVFKAILDRVSNNKKIAKLAKRIEVLERATARQAEVNTRANELHRNIVTSINDTNNYHNDLVRAVNRLTENQIAAERQGRSPGSGGVVFTASGGGGGGGAVSPDFSFLIRTDIDTDSPAPEDTRRPAAIPNGSGTRRINLEDDE